MELKYKQFDHVRQLLKFVNDYRLRVISILERDGGVYKLFYKKPKEVK